MLLCCFGLRLQFVLGLATRDDVACTTQWATNQPGLIRGLAVFFQGFRRCQVQPGLGALDDLLRNLNRHLDNCTTGSATTCGGQHGSACGGFQLLRSLGRCDRGIVSNTEYAFHDALTEGEGSASTFQCSLACGRYARLRAVNLDGLAPLHLLSGLSLDVGAEELRQQCSGGAKATTHHSASRAK